MQQYVLQYTQVALGRKLAKFLFLWQDQISRAQYIWVIDQACSVKMAGYWTPSRSINTQKKNEANIQPS